jgi:hypothetical protein
MRSPLAALAALFAAALLLLAAARPFAAPGDGPTQPEYAHATQPTASVAALRTRAAPAPSPEKPPQANTPPSPGSQAVRNQTVCAQTEPPATVLRATYDGPPRALLASGNIDLGASVARSYQRLARPGRPSNAPALRRTHPPASRWKGRTGWI